MCRQDFVARFFFRAEQPRGREIRVRLHLLLHALEIALDLRGALYRHAPIRLEPVNPPSTPSFLVLLIIAISRSPPSPPAATIVVLCATSSTTSSPQAPSVLPPTPVLVRLGNLADCRHCIARCHSPRPPRVRCEYLLSHDLERSPDRSTRVETRTRREKELESRSSLDGRPGRANDRFEW